MKFACRMEPGSPGLANLRVILRHGGCPHCRRIDTLVGHGFLWRLAPEGSDRVKTVDLKQVNAVLMQPHWHHDTTGEPVPPLAQTNQKGGRGG